MHGFNFFCQISGFGNHQGDETVKIHNCSSIVDIEKISFFFNKFQFVTNFFLSILRIPEKYEKRRNSRQIFPIFSVVNVFSQNVKFSQFQ